MQTTSPETITVPAVSALRNFDDLPGPRGIPIFGNALQFESTRMHQQLEQWSREFGALYKLKALKRKLVVVSDHGVVAQILRDRPDGFSRTARLHEIWTEMGLPIGVFGANGEVWRRQRQMVMAGFSPANVKAYFPSLQTVAKRLAGRWKRNAMQESSIDLQADLMRYTVDTIAGLAFGAEVNTLESDQDVIQDHLDKIFPTLFKRIVAPIPVWRWMRSRADRNLEHSVKEVLLAVNGFVAQARARMAANPALRESPENLIEAMIAAADQPDSGIDDAQVAGNVLTMLLAGEDTTANTLAWMIHLLWLNPEALAKATEEVRRACVNPAQPSLAEVAQLDYVEACAHETMRLKPVAPFLAFQARHDTIVGDVQLSPDVTLFCLFRRDSVSDSHVSGASTFAPERWLAGGDHSAQSASSPKRVSMPFGAGPRICPGRYLALMEMKMAIATLLGNFDIKSVDTPDRLPAREYLAFSMSPVGLTMQLTARNIG